MKGETTEYLARCQYCQQVKVEHQHPADLLQPLPVPEWKWETISLDFITGMPKTQKQNDSIMVVIDKLNKSAHFVYFNIHKNIINSFLCLITLKIRKEFKSKV